MWGRDDNGEKFDLGDDPNGHPQGSPTLAGGVFLLVAAAVGLFFLVKELFF